MERFFGFDLGDAESAVSVVRKEKGSQPDVLAIRDAKSFITAYARLMSGELLIGEEACYNPDAVERKIRFKSRFLTDGQSHKDIKSFAAGVLGELYQNGDLVQNEDCCFYIGCPAGWDKTARETYRRIFETVGYPPVKIISESRAALVSACQSKHLQVGYDILSHPVLVVDIGSSTTDFAYISGGHEVQLQTGGEVFLGGGIMDELILQESVEGSLHRKHIKDIFSKSEPWRSYCEFAARKLKEKYFNDEEYWKNNRCTQSVQIRYDLPVRLTLKMDEQIAEKILTQKTPLLNDRSWKEVFIESLRDTKKNITGLMPELIFLTGGVSRMPRITEWCKEVYPDSVVITELHPEFSVSKGLAYCGRIDEELKEFTREIDDLIASPVVEKIVKENLDDLYKRAVNTLTEPIITNAVLPVLEKWRQGGIERLCDVDGELQKEIDAYLHTDEAKKLLVKPVQEWLKPVSYAIEEHTIPICVNHNIPYKALSLNSYLSLGEVGIKVDSKNVFDVDNVTWMIDTIISVVVALLCGGGGIALIAEGLPGIIAGAIISILVLFLGKDFMQGALLQVNIPVAMRKIFPQKYFENKMQKVTEEIRQNFLDNLSKEMNQEISDRMVTEISSQIEDCLNRMAKVVEIPLG